MNSPPLFPETFTWGTATAAYQIEGAHDADGKGRNIWDAYCCEPGRIAPVQMCAPSVGDAACDHYHRWREDIALMQGLGVNAYRLSLSWSRLIPKGTGQPNPAGIAFYRNLLSGLREAGITPWVTLYHWDLPLALQQRGGWTNPDSVQWFADYAALVVREFGDLVDRWITFNEPQCFIWLGLAAGVHAPGYKLPLEDVVVAAHHMLTAHGRGVQALRAGARGSSSIGYAPVGEPKIPHTRSDADISAARTAMFDVAHDSLWNHSWWHDPVLLGRYPECGLQHHEKFLPEGWEGDLATIAQPIDFLGTNIYRGQQVAAGADGKPVAVDYPAGAPMTSFKWIVTPESLYWGPKFLHERYQIPIVITENGCANPDWVALDGTVPDLQRVDFLRRYLRELRNVMADGVPVKGYFLWSLLDNFEWAEGYRERFGIIHVDYVTHQRTPKASYAFYRDIIQSRGACL
jgi:beta-glucosidase